MEKEAEPEANGAFVRPQCDAHKAQEARQALDRIDDRNRHIMALSCDIDELARLQEDMARLVTEQGERLDTILQETENAGEAVESGVHELQEADHLARQRPGRRLKTAAVAAVAGGVAVGTGTWAIVGVHWIAAGVVGGGLMGAVPLLRKNQQP